jgi:hypothetical protein
MRVRDKAYRCVFKIGIDHAFSGGAITANHFIARPIEIGDGQLAASPEKLIERGRMAIAALLAFIRSLVGDQDFYQIDDNGDEIDEVPF